MSWRYADALTYRISIRLFISQKEIEHFDLPNQMLVVVLFANERCKPCNN